MTKKEFEKLHQICKKSWKSLAKTGDCNKPSELDVFRNDCPACELANRAKYLEYSQSLCKHCPITRWRELSIARHKYYAVCELAGEPYYKWMWYNCGLATSKKLAEEIANLEWKYLPIYKEVAFPASLLEVKIK